MRRGAVIRASYAVCLLGASYNHAAALWGGGVFYSYGGRPWPLCAFWTSLTLADPLTAFLLWRRPRWGVAATAAIIVTDVVVNSTVTWGDYTRPGAPPWHGNLMLFEQIGFCMFVAATARAAWRGAA